METGFVALLSDFGASSNIESSCGLLYGSALEEFKASCLYGHISHDRLLRSATIL